MPKLIKQDENMKVWELSQSEIKSCPNFMFDPEHYTQNSCKCYDKNDIIMRTYGYKWNNKKGCWV